MAALFIEQTLRKNNKVNSYSSSRSNNNNYNMNTRQHYSNSIASSQRQRQDPATTKETNKSMQIGFSDLAVAATFLRYFLLFFSFLFFFLIFFVHFYLVLAAQTPTCHMPHTHTHIHTAEYPLTLCFMSLCCYLLWHSALATIAAKRRPLQGTAR